jgi:AcrR family transcriptional regulator
MMVVALEERAQSRGSGQTWWVAPTPADEPRTSQRLRIVDAALACLARQGTAKTTVDDIAREAALSRATLYRSFPGGKDAILAAVVHTEVTRLFAVLAEAMGEADDLESVLVAAIVESVRRLRSHGALGYLLAFEPGVILPHLTFSKMDELLAVTTEFAAPFFERWLDPQDAPRAAEWTVRIVSSYFSTPGTTFDLAEEADARRLVRIYVLPGLLALAANQDGPADSHSVEPHSVEHRMLIKGASQ